jgi:hypothetical protein
MSESLQDRWKADWPIALRCWSNYLRIREPHLCLTHDEAVNEGLDGSFAMIRYRDQQIVIDLATVTEEGLEDYGIEILAHELGHHVVAAATVTNHLRALAHIRVALPTLESYAPLVSNLYCDLIINDRLQRDAQLRMDEVFTKLHLNTTQAGNRPTNPASHAITEATEPSTRERSEAWDVYMRIYEQLWSLPQGQLVERLSNDAMEGDAVLGARLIRSYSHRWLQGAGRFASLMLPYLARDRDRALAAAKRWVDMQLAAAGCEPMGLTSIGDDERTGAIHPANDPELNPDARTLKPDPPEFVQSNAPSLAQSRNPFEFGELIRSAGIALDDHEAAIRYYRELALPHVVPFPSRAVPEADEPQLEGTEPWESGDPQDEIDWLQTALNSPAMMAPDDDRITLRAIPGVTTVRRVYGNSPGADAAVKPVDLDLYIDSSGSMPNPQQELSYPALAGAVMALSALRAGASVKATLWSDRNQTRVTAGFTHNESDILRVLTDFFGGGTQFPIHILRDTYATERPNPTHIVHISDDGLDTMFDADEQGNSGRSIAAHALATCGSGGTMALLLSEEWEQVKGFGDSHAVLQEARDIGGWDLYRVADLEGLLAFARQFAARHYQPVSNTRIQARKAIR